MVWWHHRLDGHELEQALGIGDWQGNLACCSPWGRKGSGKTERPNWTELYWTGLNCNGTPLQYSCLENPMDGGRWWAAVWWARYESDTTEWLHFHFYVLEKEMATHSSVLAWRIPGTGEPGGLPSMGSHRVGHDWSNLAAAAAGLNWLECKSFPVGASGKEPACQCKRHKRCRLDPWVKKSPRRRAW